MNSLSVKDREHEQQLAIRNKEHEQQLALKDSEITQHIKTIREAEQITLRLDHYRNSIDLRPRIYIATTKQYAAQNFFKIGSTTRLKKRLGSYQTGRPAQDELYYCYIKQVHSSAKLDSHIQHMLDKFKEKSKREIYVMHYDDLEDLVDHFCDNFEESEEYFQKWVKTGLKQSMIKPPRIPEPIKVQDEKLVITNHFDDRESSVTDLNDLSEQKRIEVLKTILEGFRDKDRKEVSRKELLENFNEKRSWFDLVKKHFGWKNSYTVLNEFGLKIKY